MSVHDWLSDMAYPVGFDAIEIAFKGGRKGFYRNQHNLYLATGDQVVISGDPGQHLGRVVAQGEIVRLQMKKKKVTYNDDLPIVIREATEHDLEKASKSRNRELPTIFKARQIINELKLGMKLSDVEFQMDNAKATFYYSAEQRVDFRELVKRLATEFKVRVEMKQIGLRLEAGRIGGIGSCGRELCCSTWLSEFKSVGTSAARYQNLSLNPTNITGQCGRLKCCLNYELETYIEAIKDIPKVKTLKTKITSYRHQKTDIFKRLMWFSVKGDVDWIKVPVERVNHILKLNSREESPFSLEFDHEQKTETLPNNEDLLALDSKYKKAKPKRKKKRHPKKKTNEK